MSADLARALLAAIDDDALDVLAERLAPRLVDRLAQSESRGDGWLDSKRAAVYLGLSRSALYRLTAERRIPFEQSAPGGKCWFKRDALDEWRSGIA